MTKHKPPTTDGIEILHRLFYEGKPERIAALEEVRANAAVARKVYDLRTEAKLTRRQLAKRVGTTAEVIEDVEENDYEGNIFGMLYRVAAALNKSVEIRLVSTKRRAKSA